MGKGSDAGKNGGGGGGRQRGGPKGPSTGAQSRVRVIGERRVEWGAMSMAGPQALISGPPRLDGTLKTVTDTLTFFVPARGGKRRRAGAGAVGNSRLGSLASSDWGVWVDCVGSLGSGCLCGVIVCGISACMCVCVCVCVCVCACVRVYWSHWHSTWPRKKHTKMPQYDESKARTHAQRYSKRDAKTTKRAGRPPGQSRRRDGGRTGAAAAEGAGGEADAHLAEAPREG